MLGLKLGGTLVCLLTYISVCMCISTFICIYQHKIYVLYILYIFLYIMYIYVGMNKYFLFVLTPAHIQTLH